MRSLLIITVLTLFMVAMDLYAFRGIQNLMSPSFAGSRLFIMIYWGFTALMLILLIRAGTQFQQMRDPARFFGVALIMGIFLLPAPSESGFSSPVPSQGFSFLSVLDGE